MELINTSNSLEPLSFNTVVLLLLDGWGIAPASEANIISSAKTPTFDSLIKEYPVALLSVPEKDINFRYLSIGLGVSDGDDKNISDKLSLTKIFSDNNLKQIKITETERLAALTYYFNGKIEDKALGEEWKIISSQAEDSSVKPAVVSGKIFRELIKAIRSENYKFIAVSIPSIDLAVMNRDIKVVKKTIESIDKNLKKIVEIVLNLKSVLVLSSACGNAENMKSMFTELIDKQMTNNPVPIVIVGEDFKGKTIGLSEPLNNDLSLLAPAGNLEDLAPTILDIMKIGKPQEISGKSLIDNN